MRPVDERVVVTFTTPSKTKQSFKSKTDINRIVAKARDGQAIDYFNPKPVGYADVSEVPDYRTALDKVKRAEELFMALNSDVRRRFANDPMEMVVFLQDESNRAEAEKLGLLVPAAAPEVVTETPPIEVTK